MDDTQHNRKKTNFNVRSAMPRETEEKKETREFAMRESPLTIILQSSAHARALYHIFIVILVMLLCYTAILDLVEKGKLNVGQNTVVDGFGDVRRCAKLWLFMFLVAVAFYPLFKIYGIIGKILKKKLELRRIWKMFGIFGLGAVQVLLVSVPVWDLSKEYLDLASAFTVTCEMFRLFMKIHAVSMSCSPRCFDNATPLPTFGQYLYFLFAPTLLYRDHYPRTKKIRWGVAVFYFAEVAALVFCISFLHERFILPYWSDYGKNPKVEAGIVVRGMFASVFPGVIWFLCIFYGLVHAWNNAFAEIMTFGDRLFYEEWWTSSQFSHYIRLWNRIVHSWLRDHLYRPLTPRLGKAAATFIVFFISAIAHEVVLTLSFGLFYPVLTIQFAGFGLLMIPLTSASGRKFPNLLNFIIWLNFFVGNGLLWSLYPMEYYARKNCHPAENDSFFKPKSWSCPEIILKPDWIFQNL